MNDKSLSRLLLRLYFNTIITSVAAVIAVAASVNSFNSIKKEWEIDRKIKLRENNFYSLVEKINRLGLEPELSDVIGGYGLDKYYIFDNEKIFVEMDGTPVKYYGKFTSEYFKK